MEWILVLNKVKSIPNHIVYYEHFVDLRCFRNVLDYKIKLSIKRIENYGKTNTSGGRSNVDCLAE